MRWLLGPLRHAYDRWFRADPLEALIARGLTVGSGFSMQEQVSIDDSHCWLVTIGDDVTLAPDVRILAHDASMHRYFGLARIGKVEIGDRVFIGAGSIVLPGVSIGCDVIIGAGSVVSRDIPDNVVAAGNPARMLCATDEWLERKKLEIASVPSFGEEYTLRAGVSAEMKAEMNEKLIDGIGYIV